MTLLPNSTTPRRLNTWVTLAFAFMYLAWGVTYMAVHFALQSLPPFILSGTRFFLAGWILLALVAIFRRREFHAGSPREWRDAAVIGTVLFLGGNGSVAWAQQHVNTSTAALLFGTIPLFIILFEWLRPGGVRPTLRTSLGLVMGFIGLAILIKPAPEAAHDGWEVWGKGALLLGAMAWAVGAIYSRFHHAKGSPLLPMARQMICGGSALLLVATVRGDWAGLDLHRITLPSALGFTYLTTFGSLFGFTVYSWLLRVSSPERVATVPYVNTVVAVLLGWAAGEPMSLRIVIGAIIIIASVIVVLKKKVVRDTIDATPTEA
jgi:drug/metabolite transporter (DMT)-like permease